MWNRSSEGRKVVEVKKGVAWKGGLLCGFVVVLGAVVVALMLCDNQGSKNESEKYAMRNSRIKEVTPAPAPKALEETQKVQEKKTPYWELDVSKTNQLTDAQRRRWELWHRPRMEVVRVQREKAKYEIFDHPVENEIAFLLTLEPGTSVIGQPNYRRFKEDFVQSCIDKIEIKDDDDEYTKNLKQAVIETKDEIKKRIKNGEDLTDILKESRDEMRRLSEYKNTLALELRDLTKNCETDADAEIAIEAANKLLEAKGIAPFKNSMILRKRFKHIKGEYKK